MNRTDLIHTLREMASEFAENDQSARISDLIKQVHYYQSTCKQQEIKIIKLETRLADIKNYLNGSHDKEVT